MSNETSIREYRSGDAVVVVSDDRAQLGRIRYPHYPYNEARKAGVTVDEMWAQMGRPYDVYVEDDDPDPIIVTAGRIRPIDGPTNVSGIQPERFGETPKSVKRFLACLVPELRASTFEGHKKLATADPHYWVIWDRIDTVVTPEGYDHDRIEVRDNDECEVYSPIDWLEHRWEKTYGDKDEQKAILATINDTLEYSLSTPIDCGTVLGPIKGEDGLARHVAVNSKNEVVDTTYGQPKDSNYVYGIVATRPDSSEHVLDDDSIESIVNAVIDFDRKEYDDQSAEVICLRDIWGPAPHAVFLTKSAAERYLRSNRHHYHPDAHVYLDCAPRSPEYARLLSILRQLDVEHSHFATEPDPLGE